MPQTPERKAAYAKARLSVHGKEIRAQQARWREENREALKLKHKKRRAEKRAMCLVAAARVRARKKNIPFFLSEKDIEVLQLIIDNGICELSGVPFTMNGPRCATSPSLDRIVPGGGYSLTNVRVVCHALNAGMGDWGEDELRRITTAWLEARP